MNDNINTDIKNFLNKKKHTIYANSILELGVSPEYNTGEVLLASLYRKVGWKKNDKVFSEKSVIDEGRQFFKKIREEKNKREDALLSKKDWESTIFEVLSSPKMPKQAKSKNPVIYPFVPDCALYSNAARLRGKPWNPGNLLEKIIILGSKTLPTREKLWDNLFNALSAFSDDNNEDIWARILSHEFEYYRSKEYKWEKNTLDGTAPTFDESFLKNSPARQFCHDLNKVINIKSSLTRKQWLAILESLLRIGTAAHVIWVCHVNTLVWKYFKLFLKKGANFSKIETFEEFLSQHSFSAWQIGQSAPKLIKEKVKNYIIARVGINLILEKMKIPTQSKYNFNSINGIQTIANLIQRQVKSKKISISEFKEELDTLQSSDPKIISCSKGITNNILEFLTYSMRQKQTADPKKKNFDQSYWLRKKGTYNSAPWIVDIGPASILTMVFCCSYGYDQNRTVKDLLEYMKRYGFVIELSELINTNLLKNLTTLQLTVDSPDAEGGMIILNPFKNNK